MEEKKEMIKSKVKMDEWVLVRGWRRNHLWTCLQIGEDPDHPVRLWVHEQMGDFVEERDEMGITDFYGVYGQ